MIRCPITWEVTSQDIITALAWHLRRLVSAPLLGCYGNTKRLSSGGQSSPVQVNESPIFSSASVSPRPSQFSRLSSSFQLQRTVTVISGSGLDCSAKPGLQVKSTSFLLLRGISFFSPSWAFVISRLVLLQFFGSGRSGGHFWDSLLEGIFYILPQVV